MACSSKGMALTLNCLPGVLQRLFDGQGEIEGASRLLSRHHRPRSITPHGGQETGDAGPQRVLGARRVGEVGVEREAGGVAELPGKEVDIQLGELVARRREDGEPIGGHVVGLWRRWRVRGTLGRVVGRALRMTKAACVTAPGTWVT